MVFEHRAGVKILGHDPVNAAVGLYVRPLSHSASIDDMLVCLLFHQ